MNALTGMGVVAPDVPNPRALLQALQAGTCVVAPWSRPFCWDFAAAVAAATCCAAHGAAVLRGGQRAAHGLQAALVAALQAYAAAGLCAAGVPPERLGLIVAGCNVGGSQAQGMLSHFAPDPQRVPARYGLQFLDSFHVGTVSEALGLHGEGFTTGAASASGNVALIKAHQLLLLDLCDACVVVGTWADLAAVEVHALSRLGAITPRYLQGEAQCWPFDARTDGFVPGRASACVVLEQTRHAQRRGAAIHAYLAGGALCLDGTGSARPSASGEARAMRAALQQAQVHAADIDVINSHGSASKLGDATEVKSLHDVLGAHAGKPRVHASKAILGHCLWSAGVIEALVAVLQLQHGFVHGAPYLTAPVDPVLRIEAETTALQARWVLSNSFGFGGINSALVLRAA